MTTIYKWTFWLLVIAVTSVAVQALVFSIFESEYWKGWAGGLVTTIGTFILVKSDDDHENN